MAEKPLEGASGPGDRRGEADWEEHRAAVGGGCRGCGHQLLVVEAGSGRAGSRDRGDGTARTRGAEGVSGLRLSIR